MSLWGTIATDPFELTYTHTRGVSFIFHNLFLPSLPPGWLP